MQYSTTDAAAVSSLTATKLGWTLGGGYEWMFVPNWSLRAEYLYYKFDGGATTTAVFNPPNVGVLTHTWSGASVNLARVGLNYKFDWGRW
jgi:outer membrane immunogenic protein